MWGSPHPPLRGTLSPKERAGEKLSAELTDVGIIVNFKGKQGSRMG